MYFLLDGAVINADGNVIHAGYSMVHVVEIIEDYMHYGIDTFRCLYGEVGMQVIVVHGDDLDFTITGRTADEDGDVILTLHFSY